MTIYFFLISLLFDLPSAARLCSFQFYKQRILYALEGSFWEARLVAGNILRTFVYPIFTRFPDA